MPGCWYGIQQRQRSSLHLTRLGEKAIAEGNVTEYLCHPVSG